MTFNINSVVGIDAYRYDTGDTTGSLSFGSGVTIGNGERPRILRSRSAR
jgi:hypothetical protein